MHEGADWSFDRTKAIMGSMSSKKAVIANQIVTWGPIAAIVVTVSVFFWAQQLGGLLVYAGASLSGLSDTEATQWLSRSVVGQSLFMAAVKLVTFGLLYWFIRARKAGLRSLGLVRPRLRDMKYLLLGVVNYFPASILVASIIERLIPQINLSQQQQIGFTGATTVPQLLLVFISLVVLPPIIEEILFRGFLFGGLRTKLPLVWAALITSILFALPHLQFGSGEPLLWAAFIDTFILSLVLVYARVKSGSLWTAIGLHALKNCVAFVALFVFV